MANKYFPCEGCKGDPFMTPIFGDPERCVPCVGKNIAPSLKHLRTWDNTRYTLSKACDELEKVRGINSTTMKREVQALIDAGPTMPIKGQRRRDITITPLPGKKKLNCKCLNPPGRGVCVLGACVNITIGGWIITINI